MGMDQYIYTKGDDREKQDPQYYSGAERTNGSIHQYFRKYYKLHVVLSARIRRCQVCCPFFRHLFCVLAHIAVPFDAYKPQLNFRVATHYDISAFHTCLLVNASKAPAT